MALYNEKQRLSVVARAGQAVQARVSGKSSVRLGTGSTAQVFNLGAGGMCNRFIRQVFETALGIAAFAWFFGALKAYQTLAKLAPYEIPLSKRQAGDILGIDGNPGHIMLYVGRDYDPAKELVAENTSATRGWPQAPGTKTTSYATIKASLKGRTLKCYRLFPTITK